MDNNEDNVLMSQGSGPFQLSRPAHALPYTSVIEEIKADAEDGLTDDEARLRLEQHGRNELGDSDGVQPLKILIGQVANAMTLVHHTRPLLTCQRLPLISRAGADNGHGC